MLLGLGIKRRLERWYKTLLLPRTPYARFEVQGHTMLVKMQRNMIHSMYYNDFYEPQTTQWIQEHIREGQTVVDIGANIGYFTLILARQVGPRGRVYAYEPNPEIFRILRENVNANGYTSRVILNQKAVSSTLGSSKFFVTQGHGRSSLQARQWVTDIIDVETTTLDRDVIVPVDFVKIDVEGAERLVLRGMEQTMRRNPGLIFLFEYIPSLNKWEDISFLLQDWKMRGLDHNILCWREGGT